MRYVDVSDRPKQDVSYPEWISEFLSLGFREVGRLLAQPTNDPTCASLVAEYLPEHSADARRAVTTPTPILCSPDNTSFVDVSWFWGFPSVRFLTVLTDGSLVETQRRWSRAPVQIAALAAQPPKPVDEDMLAANMPQRGRSIELLTSDSASEVWETHRSHVERQCEQLDSRPRSHRTVADAIHILEAVFDHSNRIAVGAVFEGDGLGGIMLVATVALGSLAVIIDNAAVALFCLVAWLAGTAFLVNARRSSEAHDARPRFHLPE